MIAAEFGWIAAAVRTFSLGDQRAEAQAHGIARLETIIAARKITSSPVLQTMEDGKTATWTLETESG